MKTNQIVNKVHVGILGDPAKIELYNSEFYKFLTWDNTQSSFYLIGASEKVVPKKNIKEMYQLIDKSNQKILPVPNLTKKAKGVNSRIGLFPSSTKHLIKGPGFSFAPYPINSTTKKYKIQSRVLKFLLTPFLPFEVVTLAYHPMGGKAAERVRADTNKDINKINNRFLQAKKNNYINWLYLEGGSGEQFLGQKMIQSVLATISKDYIINQDENNTIIVPNSIYGGGITSITQLNEILSNKLIPQCIILGNISEENVNVTYTLVETIQTFNDKLSNLA
jgi:heptaprenylglyceryl phosphate synthase